MADATRQGVATSEDRPLVRVLLVADTHLGFDLPFRPRIQRRRRGHDFFANLNLALQPAMRGEVDLVVHGGDLFFRTRVPPALIEMALEPLIQVAEQGVPVCLVPGNHERSRIPRHLWARHPNLHVFEDPCTMVCHLPQGTVALSGFPFARRVRDRFRDLVRQTEFEAQDADFRLLCMHQTVEGARVGPADFTFRSGPDVIRGRDIPGDFHAALAGHIHRAQVLTHDLARRPLAAPVIYPGSVERTSFAERDEEKAYAIVCLGLASGCEGVSVDITFVPLPARPMVSLTIEAMEPDFELLVKRLKSQLQPLDPNAVVRLRLEGRHAGTVRGYLSAAFLRALAPPTMNISLVPDRRLPRKPGR